MSCLASTQSRLVNTGDKLKDCVAQLVCQFNCQPQILIGNSSYGQLEKNVRKLQDMADDISDIDVSGEDLHVHLGIFKDAALNGAIFRENECHLCFVTYPKCQIPLQTIVYVANEIILI